MRIAALALAGCAAAFGIFVVLTSRRPPREDAALLGDMNHLRQVTGLYVQLCVGRPGGFRFDEADRIDAYMVVEDGYFPDEYLAVFTSGRLGKGPTVAEVKARDYRNFPWTRYRRVAGKRLEPGRGRVPLLWEPRADAGGLRLVGFSDGSVRRVEETELRRLLRQHGQR